MRCYNVKTWNHAEQKTRNHETAARSDLLLAARARLDRGAATAQSRHRHPAQPQRARAKAGPAVAESLVWKALMNLPLFDEAGYLKVSPKLRCARCDARLVQSGEAEDFGACINTYWHCPEHGLQITSSTRKGNLDD